jgi:hypothetical protein
MANNAEEEDGGMRLRVLRAKACSTALSAGVFSADPRTANTSRTAAGAYPTTQPDSSHQAARPIHTHNQHTHTHTYTHTNARPPLSEIAAEWHRCTPALACQQLARATLSHPNHQRRPAGAWRHAGGQNSQEACGA